MATPLPELIARYETVGTTAVYDILDQMGYPNQALSSAVRPLSDSMSIAGLAWTFNAQTFREGVASAGRDRFTTMPAGSVIVMSTNGHRVSAPWGENSALDARAHSGRGIIIDGGTRDTAALREMNFPTFCSYVTPVFAKGRCVVVGFGEPVEMTAQVSGLLTVAVGDFVVGDSDGVVIVPKPLIEDVLAAAEELARIEGQIRNGILLGEDRSVVDARHPKFDHITKKRGHGGT